MTSNEMDAGEGEKHIPNLGDAAYKEMKERLIRGVYRPGYKMTVRAVAEDLDVSSTPARDALNRLISDGALVYAGPKTVIVPILTNNDLREITVIRIALEGLAAELGAPIATPTLIRNLIEIQTLINNALEVNDYSAALWHNKEFHFLVYRLAGMPHLISMIEGLWLRIGPSLYNLYPEFAEEKSGVRNHEMALEALNDRDGAALRAAFESDIRDGYRRLRRAAGEMEANQIQ
ncbi:GntR family transcriptional regulator [Brucella pituitosa]|uniref:GntR family transcriptional regulator n=1 Tax=Brucella pituitosa TaxID=571256 RepID=A0ABS3K3D9_9HYPH|nr:GntR family transcriptional regulator [Brucella pituitosa]MBO1040922.1 GntR family transcriptional regulator [Brucella pituitosa]PRA47495.1 GntR family transcriptional regulator [Ochrobactrum sp. MYb68]